MMMCLFSCFDFGKLSCEIVVECAVFLVIVTLLQYQFELAQMVQNMPLRIRV